MTATSLYETFNARNLEPSEVAKTFISSRHFHALIKKRHTVLLGPRGSGKTTLMKMLTDSALRSWPDPSADELRRTIGYSSVYIPYDTSWFGDLPGGIWKISETDKHTLGHAAFILSAQRALVESIGSPNRWMSCEGVQCAISEQSLTEELAYVWNLDPMVPTIKSLLLCLSRKAVNLGNLAYQSYLTGKPLHDIAGEGELGQLSDTIIPIMVAAIDVINNHIERKGWKWALLFDELEKAPAHIKNVIFSSLRSVDERLLFKIGMAPFEEGGRKLSTERLSAFPDHDYDPIILSYPKKYDALEFCERLFNGIVESHGKDSNTVKRQLGEAYFSMDDELEDSNNANRKKYAVNGASHKEIISLLSKDLSFRKYIENKQIDVNKMDTLSESKMATIRKAIGVIIVRNYIRRSSSSTTSDKTLAKKRSRKRKILYTGWQTLFAVSEGNPRWLIGLLDKLLIDENSINRRKQAREMDAACHRYRAFLRSIPLKTPSESSMLSRGILGLIDQIGNFFFMNAALKKFNAEPPLSFTVGDQVDPDIEEALGMALNAGAIIRVPNEGEDDILGSLRGCRFRISYLLAVHYCLPLNLGKRRSLHNILSEMSTDSLFDSSTEDPFAPSNFHQMELDFHE